nr:immunoglobulin heavy chain junction region [Mus musculus]
CARFGDYDGYYAMDYW